MRRVTAWTWAIVMTSALLGPAVLVQTAAAPVHLAEETTREVTLLAETGVYTEDFATYTAKDYTENTEWDIGAHALRLEPVDSAHQSNPVIAGDGSGNILVVWHDDRNGNRDIHAQRLDTNGNRLWATDVRVNSDSGVTGQDDPAMAADGNGNAAIVWRDSRNGNDDVYAQRLDANGNKLWAADVRVNSDSGATDQYAPAVAVDGSGNIVVVWQDDRNGNDDVYAQRLDASGNKLWAADVRVNSDSGTAGQYAPAVAVDGSGNAVVVWRDSRDGNANIYARRLDGNGNKLWGADTRVNADSGTADRSYPAVAVDGSGNAVAVWRDNRNGNWDIYTQRLDGGGSRLWAADVRVNSDSGAADQSYPVVAVDGSGNAVVVWRDQRSDNWDIYVQRLDGNGNKSWVADMRVNSDSGTANQYGPAVAVDGSVVVVWQDGRNGNDDIYAQRLDASGNRLWTADARVNSSNGTGSQWYPVVAVDGSGNSITVWRDDGNGNWDIYTQRLDGGGGRLWAADVRVNSDSGTADQGAPTVAVDGNGSIFAVWRDGRNGNDDIYAQRLDRSGNRLWTADVRVNSDSGTAGQYAPALAMDGDGNAFVVWMDNRNGNDNIYAQKLDANGDKPWAADVRVNSGSGATEQRYPAAAVDGNGNVVVVWQDDQSGNWDVYAQKLDEGGSRLWAADMQANSDSGAADQWYPAVVEDGSRNVVVVWQDERNGNNDIYGQKLDTNGSKLWAADVRVNSDSGTADQDFPAIAADESENAVIVWQDGRNGDDDIYAQKLDGDGSKLWAADVRVNSDSGAAGQDNPVVVVDGSRNGIIVWKDERNRNPDIYAQRISAGGGKTWSADVQIVYPDRFYFPTGTAQSRTVDTVTGTIRSATLTADYWANGGSVQFSLTNDGGTHWVTTPLGAAAVFTTTGSDLRWRAVLSADPLWPRTPVVNSLRIEYSTQASYADDYEPDDICAQAQPIQVNGAAQAHTFHQQADADWAWFNVTSGTTYVVQTSNTQTNADTVLELRSSCPQPPLDSDDNAFGNDARITWQATFSGPVYVKVANHTASVYGPDTGYDLSVRTFTQPPVAVIVGGHDDGYRLQANIDHAADMAYRTFLNSGVPKANLRYFGPNPHRDVDGNGLNDDIYATVTLTGVREAVQDWSRAQGMQLGVPFYVYLVDHGHYDQFMAAGASSKITATDLDLWLSNLEATSGTDNVNVILEACHSGSFIDVTNLGPAEVSGRNRVVIASTSSGLNAYPSVQGAYFSDAFWTALGQNQDLKTAFEAAKQAVQATGLSQQPWLDDNGDALADGRDGALARSRGLGSPFAGSPPAIDWVRMGPVSGGQATVVAQVRDDFGVAGVWAVVYPPGFVEPEPTQDGTTPVLNVPTATLTLAAGTDLYGTAYRGFTQTGQYRLVVYAQDGDGNQALPQAVGVCAGRVYLPLVLRGW